MVKSTGIRQMDGAEEKSLGVRDVRTYTSSLINTLWLCYM